MVNEGRSMIIYIYIQNPIKIILTVYKNLNILLIMKKRLQ
jgi:hypothetical protein